MGIQGQLMVFKGKVVEPIDQHIQLRIPIARIKILPQEQSTAALHFDSQPFGITARQARARARRGTA
jgi:hypothetical protein